MNKVSWATNMRMFAVLGVVFIHCNNYLIEIKAGQLVGFLDWGLQIFFKPATILFFIISGYLFEAKFGSYSSNSFGNFFIKKTKTLLLPYFFIFILFNLVYNLFIEPNFGEVKHSVNYLQEMNHFFNIIFYSTYWFIPVLFLYIILNYFINSSVVWYWFWPSLLVTIFYSLNIYFHFTTHTGHTTAIPGFMTFFLLGRLIFMGKFNGTKFRIVILGVAFVSSLFESLFLGYDTNTLRFFNGIYSVLFFLSLKEFFGKFSIPIFFTSINYYFFYLIHPIVITHIVGRFFVLYPIKTSGIGVPSHWVFFILVLVFSIAIEKAVFSFSNPISSLFKFGGDRTA